MENVIWKLLVLITITACLIVASVIYSRNRDWFTTARKVRVWMLIAGGCLVLLSMVADSDMMHQALSYTGSVFLIIVNVMALRDQNR